MDVPKVAFISKKNRGSTLKPPNYPVAKTLFEAPEASHGPTEGALKELVISSELRQKELDHIKTTYLGLKRQSSARHGSRDKKLLFEWNLEDDTSADPFGYPVVSIPVKTPQRNDDGSFIVSKQSKTSERHWSGKPLEEMLDRDWRIFKEDYEIATKGGSIPHPIRFWKESSLSMDIVEVIDRFGYAHPTPIQRQSIPIIALGRDMIGIAETGSGKTLAFLLPLFNRLDIFAASNPASNGPFGLILAPTRELAIQIEAECCKLCKGLGRKRPVAIVGGRSITEQSFYLSQGTDIVIATPGRLKDCLDQRIVTLDDCKYVVLDEADRMIDMGFEADLTVILSSLPQSVKPQKIMFSATMPPLVERIAANYLKTPAVVTIGNAGQAVERIEQRVELLSDPSKRSRLFEILNSTEFRDLEGPCIVFTNFKDTVDSLVRHLTNQGFLAVGLHGGRSQDHRESILQQLKGGKADILVATDVASRGIDIPNVSLVVNYDMASSIEVYVHRIGRTGRAGKSGLSITFLTQNDASLFYDLKRLLLTSKKNTCPPELARHEASNLKPGSAPQKKKSDETIFK